VGGRMAIRATRMRAKRFMGASFEKRKCLDSRSDSGVVALLGRPS
jgi:hypothetical protein